MMNEFRKIFELTKTIAIVGLSPNHEKSSHIVAKYLQNKGFKVIPIYQKRILFWVKKFTEICKMPKSKLMVEMFRNQEFAMELLLQIEKRDDAKIEYEILEKI